MPEQVLPPPAHIDAAESRELAARTVDAASFAFQSMRARVASFRRNHAHDDLHGAARDLAFHEAQFEVAKPVLHPDFSKSDTGESNNVTKELPDLPPLKPYRALDAQAESHDLLDLMREHKVNTKEKLQELGVLPKDGPTPFERAPGSLALPKTRRQKREDAELSGVVAQVRHKRTEQRGHRAMHGEAGRINPSATKALQKAERKTARLALDRGDVSYAEYENLLKNIEKMEVPQERFADRFNLGRSEHEKHAKEQAKERRNKYETARADYKNGRIGYWEYSVATDGNDKYGIKGDGPHFEARTSHALHKTEHQIGKASEGTLKDLEKKIESGKKDVTTASKRTTKRYVKARKQAVKKEAIKARREDRKQRQGARKQKKKYENYLTKLPPPPNTPTPTPAGGALPRRPKTP